MKVLDLFSGIGGFSLGLERAGFTTVAFCEIEPFCRAVLKKHWPHVPCYEDVRTLTAERLAADGISVDVICGGFPCQDISTAGKQAGITAERSGLWSELARIIGEVRPSYAIVENVTNLLSGPGEQPGGWFGVVLGDLAEIGYDCQWHSIPASALGAPHIRDRVWLIAYPQHSDTDQPGLHRAGMHQQRSRESADKQIRLAQSLGLLLANALSTGLEGCAGIAGHLAEELASTERDCEAMADAGRITGQIPFAGQLSAIKVAERHSQWATEPDVGRVAHGVPSRVDRLRALGNAVVPQIPEIIGRAILAAEAA